MYNFIETNDQSNLCQAYVEAIVCTDTGQNVPPIASQGIGEKFGSSADIEILEEYRISTSQNVT